MEILHPATYMLLQAPFSMAQFLIFRLRCSLLKLTSEKYNFETVLLMPVYNVEQSLTIVISLLEQLGKDDHLIVLINGNKHKNKSLDQLKFLGKNLHVFRSKRPLGTIGSFNYLLSATYLMIKPTFFAFVSDHDALSDNWIYQLKNTLYNDNTLVGTWAETKAKFTTEKSKEIELPLEILKFAPSKMPLNTSINKKLIDAYFGTTELNNNFGYAFYGMFRLQRFRNLGLVPEIVFGDRFFLMKLLATGGRVEKTSKAFRVDRKTNKAKPNSQIILEQFEKISSKKKSHEVHVEAAFNLWNFFNHGQYLFGNPKIDMRLIRAAHNIFFCAKFNKLAVKINKAESHQDYRVKIKPYNTSRQTKL